MYMHIELYNLMVHLDEDEGIKQYFSWTEPQKKMLTKSIRNFLQPVISKGDNHKLALMGSIWKIIKEAEAAEEYEHADIFSRCLKLLEEQM